MKASNFAYWFSNAHLNLRPYNWGGPQVYLATWVRSLIKTVHLRVYNGVAFIVYFFLITINQEIFVTHTNKLALEINNSGVAVTFLKTLVDDRFFAESEK